MFVVVVRVCMFVGLGCVVVFACSVCCCFDVGVVCLLCACCVFALFLCGFDVC